MTSFASRSRSALHRAPPENPTQNELTHQSTEKLTPRGFPEAET